MLAKINKHLKDGTIPPFPKVVVDSPQLKHTISAFIMLKRGVGKLVINEGHPVRMGKNGDLDIQFGYLHFVLLSHK